MVFSQDTKQELLKYYKKVKICKKCGRNYGSDNLDEVEKNLCPICISSNITALSNETRRIKKIEKEKEFEKIKDKK